MIKISAVIITYNEERNIGRCLNSLMGVVDEIIVVDSFSTDKTERICNSYPDVRFIQRTWDNYSNQKDYGAKQAQYLYVLSLDADEYLSPKLRDSILSAKQSDIQYDAYSLNILNIYCGKKIRHGSWYPGRKVRLWNVEKGKWNGAHVHEHIELEKGTKTRHLKGDLFHNSHASISEHVQKINHYTDIGAELALQKKKKVGIIKIFASFVWRFFRDYFIKLGILDGAYGLIICILNSYESFLKYSKLYQKKKLKHTNSEIELKKGQILDAGNIFSILIPTWNNLTLLKLCVESIRKHSKYKHQLIVHVNEGIDGTLQWVQEQGLDYTYSKENVGVCHALNASYQLATTDYILYINDDMYVCPNWDEALWNEIQQQPDEKFYLSATAIEPIDVGKKIAIAPHDYGLKPETFDEEQLLAHYLDFAFSDWCGSSWPPAVVHRKMWDVAGGYSAEFSPGMYSDPDFSMKLWQAGVRRFKGVSASRVYHFLESSTKRLKSSATTDASHLFLKKWGITARAFYRYYLRMGEPYRELPEVGNDWKFLSKKFLCKLKRLFI